MSDVVSVLRSEHGDDVRLPNDLINAVNAVHDYWTEAGPAALSDIAAIDTDQRALRIGRHTVLRTSMAWQPIVFATATFAALVLSGGVGVLGGVALGAFAVQFLNSFTRIAPYNRPVFEAVCALQAKHKADGGPSTAQVAASLSGKVEAETIERRLQEMERQDVLRQRDGHWSIPP
jgi:hypothetical protein